MGRPKGSLREALLVVQRHPIFGSVVFPIQGPNWAPGIFFFSENAEKTKNLLYAQKIDAKNFELGKSISPDIKEKWVENMISAEMNNHMVFSGLEYLDSSIEEKKIIRNFTDNIDYCITNSNYFHS